MDQRDRYLGLRVQVVRYLSFDPQPGVVECELVDAHGRSWFFHEKAVVSEATLSSTSEYPQAGVIGCVEVSRTTDAAGRKIIRIDTEMLWGSVTVDDVSQFDVLPSQLAVFDLYTCEEVGKLE